MNPAALTRACLASLALLALAACERDEHERLVRQIEEAKQRELELTNPPPVQQPAPNKRPEDSLTDLREDQRLVLFCAGDLRDPVQAMQLRILQTTVPALASGLVLKHLDAAGEASLQLRHLQAAAKAKPTLLIVQALEGRLTSALLQDLRSTGTVVFGLDSNLPAEACDQCAFVDQKKLGALAGEVALAALKRKAQEEGQSQVTGRIVQITSIDDATTAKDQRAGLEEALQKESGVVLVHDAPGEWTREGAGQRIAEALRLQGQFDVVIAQSDAMAQGVSEALTAAGKREQVLIISIGGLRQPDGGVELLRQAAIDAVILHPLPMEKLYPALQQFATQPGFKPAPLRDELAPGILTPKNLNDALRR